MTPGTPASSLHIAIIMIAVPYPGKRRLDMATQAQVRVAGHQHFIRDGPVDFMTRRASVAKGLMFPHVRSALLFVTFETRFIGIFHTGRCPWPSVNTMNVMTVGTAHLAFQNRVMKR